MKAEDIYDAITDLPDGQITEGEQKLPRTGRRWIRWAGLAAALAVVVLSGVLFLRRPKPVGAGVSPGLDPSAAQESTSAELHSGDPEAPTETGAERVPDSSDPVTTIPGGALDGLPYSLAFASCPRMAPYPVYGTMNGKDYDAARQAWLEDRMALKPEGDYSLGMDACMKRLIPALLEGTPGENRAASPLNVWMALALLAETTDGNSRRELLELLNVPDPETLRTQAGELWRACYCDDGVRSSLLGASLWLRDDKRYSQSTLDRLAEHYYASSFSGPMGEPEYTKALRDWTDEHTGGLLTERVNGMELRPDTVLALITTVYFKTPWQDEFYHTERGSFHSPRGDRDAEFMLEGSAGSCWFGADFTAAGKALMEGGSMYFLLPREGVSPEALLEEEETLRFLSDAAGRDSVENRYVILDLSVPKFDVSAQLGLEEPLKALGVEAVFDPVRADFSPLAETGASGVCVTDARHAARVMIDEKGVTAAAFTEFAAGAGEPPEERVELKLDRPFLFVLTNEDGLPLFVGIVNEPGV